MALVKACYKRAGLENKHIYKLFIINDIHSVASHGAWKKVPSDC